MKQLLVVFLVMALVLSGCSASTALPEETSGQAASSAIPVPTGTALVIVLPVEPTSTQANPSATPAPSQTAAPTRTPAPTPTATELACWSEPGRVESGSMRSKLLKLPMEYSVYLPPCYDQQPDRRYPVLYMIHGMNYNNDQWDRLGADEARDALVAAGEVNPFIIVMPRDRNWDLPEQDPFGEVVVEALIPYIDETYRTLPDREHRVIGGLSRGAGWAVHLGLSRWDLFSAIGGHSLPVFWSDTRRVRGWLADIPPESYPRIYLDIGDKDRSSILNSARWFENLLNEEGIPHEWYLNRGYHEEAYWASHVETYLRWYAQDW